MKQLSSLLKISVSVLFIFLSLTASAGYACGLSPGVVYEGTGYSFVIMNGVYSTLNKLLTPVFNISSLFELSLQIRRGILENPVNNSLSIGLKIDSLKYNFFSLK